MLFLIAICKARQQAQLCPKLMHTPRILCSELALLHAGWRCL